jgi:hypothetical protein
MVGGKNLTLKRGGVDRRTSHIMLSDNLVKIGLQAANLFTPQTAWNEEDRSIEDISTIRSSSGCLHHDGHQAASRCR